MFADTGAKAVRLMLESGFDGKKVKQSYVADLLGISPQGFNDKLRRDSFSFTDVMKIAMWLGYDVTLASEKTGVIECKRIGGSLARKAIELMRRTGGVLSEDEKMELNYYMVEALDIEREMSAHDQLAIKRALAKPEIDED